MCQELMFWEISFPLILFSIILIYENQEPEIAKCKIVTTTDCIEGKKSSDISPL